jgi:hypothetical protein
VIYDYTVRLLERMIGAEMLIIYLVLMCPADKYSSCMGETDVYSTFANG